MLPSWETFRAGFIVYWCVGLMIMLGAMTTSEYRASVMKRWNYSRLNATAVMITGMLAALLTALIWPFVLSEKTSGPIVRVIEKITKASKGRNR